MRLDQILEKIKAGTVQNKTHSIVVPDLQSTDCSYSKSVMQQWLSSQPTQHNAWDWDGDLKEVPVGNCMRCGEQIWNPRFNEVLCQTCNVLAYHHQPKIYDRRSCALGRPLTEAEKDIIDDFMVEHNIWS